MSRRMSDLGSGDQQLGRHAAYSGTGGSVRARFNQYGAGAFFGRGSSGGKPGRSGADDSDIDFDRPHGRNSLTN